MEDIIMAFKTEKRPLRYILEAKKVWEELVWEREINISGGKKL